MCRSFIKILQPFALLLAVLFGEALANEENPRWRLGVIGGIGTDGGIEDVPGGPNSDFERSYFVSLALAREFARHGDAAAWEVEGQMVKHFAGQDHWEFNGVLVFRWLWFPWDEYLDTSLAFGEGVSYATQIPEIEDERSDETSHLLNYLLFELEFALPNDPRWSIVARLHHRSGVFGLYDGVSAGSNFVAVGVKYDF